MNHMHRTRPIHLLAALVVPGTLGLAACNTEDASASAPVVIEAHEFSFTGPASLGSGPTTIRFHDAGTAPHQLQLLKLNDGVTVDDAIAAAKDPNPGTLLSKVGAAGGVNTLAPGASQDVTLDLTAGTYLEVSFAGEETGAPDIAKGMVGSFTVTAKRGHGHRPKTSGTFTLQDFSITVPKEFDGSGSFRVVNQGKQPHEVGFAKLPDGTTMDDVMKAVSDPNGTPPPMTPAGGFGAIDPGQRGIVTLDLPSGTYLVSCFVPDPTTGKPHAMLGMMTVVTVH